MSAERRLPRDSERISGVARNVNWGAPLHFPSPRLPLSLLTGVRGIIAGNFLKLKVLVGEF